MSTQNPKRLVIVGGVAAGASAAARARRLSEEAEIIVFERGPHVSFANCGLPYFVGGEIDRARRLIQARELDSGAEYELGYDALLLATGAAPLRPPIPGIDRPGHFTPPAPTPLTLGRVAQRPRTHRVLPERTPVVSRVPSPCPARFPRPQPDRCLPDLAHRHQPKLTVRTLARRAGAPAS